MDPMRSKDASGRSTPVARLLAMAAVLVGLLAMHGLASTHHGAAARAHAPLGAPIDEQVGAGHSHTAAAPLSTMASLPSSVASASLPACDGHCPIGLGVMCLAVLTVAAAAGAAAPARRATGPVRPRALRAASAAAPRHPLRLLDPVADLCVSRT